MTPGRRHPGTSRWTATLRTHQNFCTSMPLRHRMCPSTVRPCTWHEAHSSSRIRTSFRARRRESRVGESCPPFYYLSLRASACLGIGRAREDSKWNHPVSKCFWPDGESPVPAAGLGGQPRMNHRRGTATDDGRRTDIQSGRLRWKENVSATIGRMSGGVGSRFVQVRVC